MLIVPANAGVTELSGNSPTYAGEELVFFTIRDYITLEEKEISRCKVSADGSFTARFDIGETVTVIVYLGAYKGSMYIEPDKKYLVIIPDKKEKTDAERLNPYFVPTEFMIGVSKGGMNEMNFMIKTFENSYYPYYNKLAVNINVAQNNTKELERAITEMEKPWKDSDNEFLKQYVHYRIGLLRLMASQFKSKAISEEYFSKKKILYYNPAYMELFNQVYDKYFLFFSTTPEGKSLFDDVNKKKSFAALKKTLRTDQVLADDSLLEMVVLKNIHDNFYSDKFTREGMLDILDTIAAQSASPMHRQIAVNIRTKVTKLMPGFPAPGFVLFDKDDTPVDLQSFRGSWVYLNFCSCSSYACFKEFDLLNKLQDKYGDKLKIITVLCDGSPDVMRNYLSRNPHKWIFLHYANQPTVQADYRIKAYPVYYFIDKEGKLVYSPAPSPAENFESYFTKYLESKCESAKK